MEKKLVSLLLDDLTAIKEKVRNSSCTFDSNDLINIECICSDIATRIL